MYKGALAQTLETNQPKSRGLPTPLQKPYRIGPYAHRDSADIHAMTADTVLTEELGYVQRNSVMYSQFWTHHPEPFN